MGNLNRPEPSLEARRRRLRFRAQHRGIKEMDLILGAFADEVLADLSAERLASFERLVELPDQELYDWIVGRAAVPAEFADGLMDELMTFTSAVGGVAVRR